MEDIELKIDEVYIPVKRRREVDERYVNDLAEDILEKGQEVRVLVRRDAARFVLVDGLHRLEALRALGEDTIKASVVRARRH